MLIRDKNIKLSLLFVIIYEIVKISADKNIDDTHITAEDVLGRYISFIFKALSIANPNIKNIVNKNAIKYIEKI